MASFDRVKAGDTLYSVYRTKMGNTNMGRLGCWHVYVVSIDYEKRTAVCRRNGNPPCLYTERMIKRLRRSRPKEKT